MPETTAAHPSDDARPGIDASDEAGLLAEDAVVLVAHWINAAGADETRDERALGDRLAGLIADPDGVAFTMRFVDRVVRHRDDRAAARALAHLVAAGARPGPPLQLPYAAHALNPF